MTSATPPGALALFSSCATLQCQGIATEAGEVCDTCAAKLTQRPPCLYGSTARGLAARDAEFEAWQAEYGSLRRSHAWTLGLCVPSGPADRCQPTLLRADVRDRAPWKHDTSDMPDCSCCTEINDYLFRGACRGCDWEGNPRPDMGENPAVEDAMDHAWPGWRRVPIVPPYPDDKKAQARWVDKVVPQYPAGWLEAGGPIRTLRDGTARRHHGGVGTTPWGGYDMGVVRPPTHTFTAVSKTGQPSKVQGITADVTVEVWGDDDLRWRVHRAAKDPDLEVTVVALGGAR